MSLNEYYKLISSFRFFGAKQRFTGGVSRPLLAIMETSATLGVEGVGVESGRGEFERVVMPGVSGLFGIRQKLSIISSSLQ